MIEKIVALLNEAAALDPAAMKLLVAHRQSCSDKLADRLTGAPKSKERGIGMGGGGFRQSLGMIELLNGLEPGKKRIVVVTDDDPMTPIRFEVAPF